MTMMMTTTTMMMMIMVMMMMVMMMMVLQVTWYREGVVIEKSERFQTELRTEVGQPHNSSLTILNAQVADAGTYQVVISNEFGESIITISLAVTG